jgi:xanthine dehydrogenase small subunit
MERLRFYLNDRAIDASGSPPTTTLLRYIRDRAHLMGTKEGCAEGDCGACSVAILEPDGYRSVCSCLVLLPMVQGKRVYTVEGIKDGDRAHLVQRTLAEALGSQCGYCTPGVTMSLFEACYRDDLDEAWKLDAQMCGNLCRCTGYRPIRDALKRVAEARPKDRFLESLGSANRPSMALAYETAGQRFYTPESFDELWSILDREPDARFVAGGTDLSLEVTKRFAEPPLLVSLEGIEPLAQITPTAGGFRFGAGANLSRIENATRFSLPAMERMLRYFGSRQIKNRATIGGNLCTASPIGDLAPVLLALGAEVVLLSRKGERKVPIDRFFIAYRKTALEPGEILAYVDVERPPPESRVTAYKVSKRRELDISTVAACFCVRVEGGIVHSARLAYGGMAATPSRAPKTEAKLIGARWDEANVEAAAKTLDEDFAPISDHRGSAWYRATLARNLLRGFFRETVASPSPRLAHGHVATVAVE